MQLKMGWSTRELAELAGTTLKTVRHYHRIGLLEEPERAANGYKRYRLAHLIRLLRIRRLVDLGVSLTDIAATEESDEGAEQTFRALDAELAASIERQQKMREDLAAILRERKLLELPPGVGEGAGDSTEADRAFLLMGSQMLEPGVMQELRELHDRPRSEVDVEFAALTDEASNETRQSLAERYAPEIRRDQQNNPHLTAFSERGPQQGDPHVWSAIVQGIANWHNAAQIDVLQRVHAILYPPG